MSLKEDAKKILESLLGPEVAKQVERFDDPEKYAEDFIEECIYFLGVLIGDKAARKRFEPLIKKYLNK